MRVEIEHLNAFVATHRRIEQHNKLFKAGNVTFSLAVNHLSDLPMEKYRKLNGYTHFYLLYVISELQLPSPTL